MPAVIASTLVAAAESVVTEAIDTGLEIPAMADEMTLPAELVTSAARETRLVADATGFVASRAMLERTDSKLAAVTLPGARDGTETLAGETTT